MSQEQSTPGLNLLIPEGIRYNCQGCGRCCTGWSVGMTEEDYAKVKDTDWQSLSPALKDKEVFFHREKEFEEGTAAYPHYTKPTADGSCIFLIDNLCFMHSTLGEASKPTSCRVFPYSFVETPTGVYAGVVYNSMAAVRNIGEPLTEQREKLADHFALSVHYNTSSMRASDLEAQLKAVKDGTMVVAESPFARVKITPACELDWPEYLAIEERMIKLIKARIDIEPENGQASANIFDTLLQCSEILMQGRKLKVSGGNVNDIADFEPSIKAPSDIAVSNMEFMTLRMLYYRFFVYPTVRTSDTSLWQMQRKRAFEPKVAINVARAFSKYIGSGLGTILFAQAGLPMLGKINLVKALNQKFAPPDAEIDKLFHRWLYLKLFSKSYFGPAAAGFSVLSGFNSLTASILSVLLYTKSAAMHNAATANSGKTGSPIGLPQMAIADLYEAYWRLDRELLTMGQTPEQESRFYNSGLSSPRLFNKSLWAMANSFK
jgi:Fe-S-cluster containining protein